MALYVWLLLALTLFTQGHGYTLKWPSEYTVKATKILVTSNLVENLQIWRTQTRSRIDYNDGEVTSIARGLSKSMRYVRTYDIHPEAFMNQSVFTACYYTTEKYGSLEDILPDVEDLEYVGKEDNTDKHTVKYQYVYSDDETNIRGQRTLWAIRNFRKKYWYPVRYEELQYNTALGYKDVHEIWEFSNFTTDFSINNIFDVKSYKCKKKPIEDAREHDAVTKHLIFIDPEKDDHVDHVFNTFKIKYGKKYSDEKEHAFRRRIFQNNMRLIAATNNKNLGYKLTINKFADRTTDELNKYKGLLPRPAHKIGNLPFQYTQKELTELAKDLPKEYDSRLYGLVSTVKDQGECGSCWTFGTTAAVEGALALANGGSLLALANQAVLDCAWPFGATGCDGGADIQAYKWMMEYGLPTEAEYGPYKNRNGKCNIKNMTKLYPIRGFTDVTPRGVEALKIALINHGPLSVSVHASTAFRAYASGIFYDPLCNQTNLNHEVALVGYGERYGETFWILKNSWGPNWGIDGYMHISAKDNVCGVTTEPTFVVF